GRARGRRRRPLADLPSHRARIVRVLEEELSVAGETIHGDLVGRHPRGVDEGDDEAGAAPGEPAVELEAGEEGMGDGAEPGQVVEVLGGGGDEGVESLRLEHRGQARLHVAVHERLLKLGITSRPKSSIASRISATVLATKSKPESVVT